MGDGHLLTNKPERPPPGSRLRVLLVDDSPAFLQAARQYLAAQAWIEIVGQAGDGTEAVAQSEALKPDLVLMDVAMPGMNGIEAARRIARRPGAPRVVLFSLHDNDEYRRCALESGAEAFLAKLDLVTGLEMLRARLFAPGTAQEPTP